MPWCLVKHKDNFAFTYCKNLFMETVPNDKIEIRIVPLFFFFFFFSNWALFLEKSFNGCCGSESCNLERK
jgi:hypothetical protein